MRWSDDVSVSAVLLKMTLVSRNSIHVGLHKQIMVYKIPVLQKMRNIII